MVDTVSIPFGFELHPELILNLGLSVALGIILFCLFVIALVMLKNFIKVGLDI